MSAVHVTSSAISQEQYDWYIRLPWLFLLVLGVLGVMTPLPGWIAPVPFIISLLVLGMPHGATDFDILSRNHLQRSTKIRLLKFFPYVLAMTASLALLLTSAPWGLALFGIFSIWHFGEADAADLADRSPRPITSLQMILLTWTRGALPVLLPFLFHPLDTTLVLNDLLRLLNSESIVSAGLVAKLEMLAAISAIACVFMTLWFACRGQMLIARDNLLEVFILMIAAAHLSPLLFVGGYFLLWHSWRHLRLVRAAISPGSNPVHFAFLGVYRSCWKLLLPTLVAISISVFLMEDVRTLYGLTLLLLIVFAVVTPPHHALVILTRHKLAGH